VRADRDLIPEAAIRPSQDNSDYHTGRGGAGNVEHVAPPHKDGADGNGNGKPAAPISLADKLKMKIFGVFKK
jgi:hypothetical protein